MNKLPIIVTILLVNLSMFGQVNIESSLTSDSVSVDSISTVLSDSLSQQQLDSLQTESKKDTLKPLEYLSYTSKENSLNRQS